jgi:hypothetical protein
MLTLTILVGLMYALRFESNPLEGFVGPTRLWTLAKCGGAALFICFVVINDVELSAHLCLQHEVNSALGFDYETPELEEGEVFLITDIVPGEFMEKTGLRVDDQICYDSVDDLYHQLLYNQGKRVSIPIKRGARVFSIEFCAPRIKTCVNPNRIWWWL